MMPKATPQIPLIMLRFELLKHSNCARSISIQPRSTHVIHQNVHLQVLVPRQLRIQLLQQVFLELPSSKVQSAHRYSLRAGSGELVKCQVIVERVLDDFDLG